MWRDYNRPTTSPVLAHGDADQPVSSLGIALRGFQGPSMELVTIRPAPWVGDGPGVFRLEGFDSKLKSGQFGLGNMAANAELIASWLLARLYRSVMRVEP